VVEVRTASLLLVRKTPFTGCASPKSYSRKAEDSFQAFENLRLLTSRNFRDDHPRVFVGQFADITGIIHTFSRRCLEKVWIMPRIRQAAHFCNDARCSISSFGSFKPGAGRHIAIRPAVTVIDGRHRRAQA